jgi:riboflavin kinase/FMN adenylyltransferase
MNKSQARGLPRSFSGTVTRYKGDGRRLGYPTANISTRSDAKDGVYFGYADLDGFSRHPSLIFVGTPTTMGDMRRRVEVHLLDIPDRDYYDLPLEVSAEHYHRANHTFKDVAELVEFMHADEAAARRWFAERS